MSRGMPASGYVDRQGNEIRKVKMVGGSWNGTEQWVPNISVFELWQKIPKFTPADEVKTEKYKMVEFYHAVKSRHPEFDPPPILSHVEAHIVKEPS